MTTREELAGMVRELDSLLPVPSDPTDTSVPVRFGSLGVVFMSENGQPFLLGSYGHPDEMEADREAIQVFAQGYGHLLAVSYGAFIVTDEDDEERMTITRVIIGLTPDQQSVLLRDLAEDEVVATDNDGDIENDGLPAHMRSFFG